MDHVLLLIQPQEEWGRKVSALIFRLLYAFRGVSRASDVARPV